MTVYHHHQGPLLMGNDKGTNLIIIIWRWKLIYYNIREETLKILKGAQSCFICNKCFVSVIIAIKHSRIAIISLTGHEKLFSITDH